MVVGAAVIVLLLPHAMALKRGAEAVIPPTLVVAWIMMTISCVVTTGGNRSRSKGKRWSSSNRRRMCGRGGACRILRGSSSRISYVIHNNRIRYIRQRAHVRKHQRFRQ